MSGVSNIGKISWSAYKMYDDCPLAYKKQYIEKIKSKDDEYNSLGGKIIQRVFELFYNDEIWRRGSETLKELESIFDQESEYIIKKSKADWSIDGRSPEKLKAQLKPLIKSILKMIIDEKLLGSYSKAEVKLQAWIDKVLIFGIADFIIRKDNEMIILDGKLTKHRDKYLKRDQLVWYAMIYYLQHQVEINKLGWIYYTYGEVSWVDIDRNDLVRLHKSVKSTLKSIQDENFESAPSQDTCKFCNFRDTCSDVYTDTPTVKKKRSKGVSSALLDDSSEVSF